MAAKEYLERRSGERNVDSRIQVQLEEDGNSNTKQWFVAYVPPGATRHNSS